MRRAATLESTHRRRAWLATRTATVAALGCMLAGCGAGGPDASTKAAADPTASTTATSGACSHAVLATLDGVAKRIYNEAAGGRVMAQAMQRLQHSGALLGAVERADPRATRRVLRGLIESQIVRVRVTRGARVLADIGKRNAIAPTSAPLRNARGREVGKVVISVEGANGFAQTVAGFIGARVLVLSGSRRVADTRPGGPAVSALPMQGPVSYRGAGYQAGSFTASAFPSGPLRVELLLPNAALGSCGATEAETAALTIGRVGMRIYAGEQGGPRVNAIVRHVERSRAFRNAVLSDSPAATRAAIVGFFRTHLHVVRVRAMLGAHLVTDLGGPFVLAPVPGVIRDRRGRVRGRFLLAVQDDMGYMLLAHRFTGAEVLMRVGSRQVMGTLDPGPEAIPDHGPVSYGGVDYQAFSFVGQAFPSGQLRISLLVPTG